MPGTIIFVELCGVAVNAYQNPIQEILLVSKLWFRV